MDRHQVEQLAEQFIDRLHQFEQNGEQHLEALVALFSDEARLTNAALTRLGEERRGRDGIRAFWDEYRRTFSTVRSDFDQVTASDRAAGLFWTTRGAGHDGRSVEYAGVSLLEFDDGGRIARFRGYYDPEQLGREVGAE